jgi:transcriptional antiterminator Rof (Rho-off)
MVDHSYGANYNESRERSSQFLVLACIHFMSFRVLNDGDDIYARADDIMKRIAMTREREKDKLQVVQCD